MYANPLAPVVDSNAPLQGVPDTTPGVRVQGARLAALRTFSNCITTPAGIKAGTCSGSGASISTSATTGRTRRFRQRWISLSNGGGLGPALNGLLSGQFTSIEVAVDPQGKLPCAQGAPATDCSINLPVSSPNFSRSNRFNEGALYAQDYWRLTKRISVSLGLRWEHYGVQHNGNSNLDSNWYAPGITFSDHSLGSYLRTGGLQTVPKSPIGSLWKPDWKDFAPRVGVAWDITGSGRTVIRAGYGMAYERNFGNVTFNVIQNLPGYAVLDVPGLVSTNNFGPLAASSGSIALPPVGARIVNPGLKTAYARFWNASVQRQITTKLIYTFDYSGSKGVNLYSISYPNQAGFGNFVLGDPCTGNADCVSQPNSTYAEDVGYRGNQGFSNYYGLNNRLSVRDIWKLGVQLSVNYTWSHATDNLSSTFFETGGGGVAGLYGNRNITTNNGDFDTGLLDPYQPALDKGDAEFDVRHRVALFRRLDHSIQARLGLDLEGCPWVGTSADAYVPQPFSVFDTSTQTLDLSAPRASFTSSAPKRRNTFVPSTMPDTFHIITFLPSQISGSRIYSRRASQWPTNSVSRSGILEPRCRSVQGHRAPEVYAATSRRSVQRLQSRESVRDRRERRSSNTVDGLRAAVGPVYDRRQSAFLKASSQYPSRSDDRADLGCLESVVPGAGIELRLGLDGA